MNEVKFIEFKKITGEKHVGIITILINNIVYLRYKVSPGKNGGFFPNPPSYKVTEKGQDSYIPSFVFESNMLREQVDSCLKTNINREMASNQMNSPITEDCPF